jgi:hypothetical protein
MSWQLLLSKTTLLAHINPEVSKILYHLFALVSNTKRSVVLENQPGPHRVEQAFMPALRRKHHPFLAPQAVAQRSAVA